MKKALLFTFAMLFAMATMAQNRTTLLEESFDGTSMPAGWQVMENGTSCWSISATQNAGGTANELKLYYSPQFNGTSRMVMPEVDLTGISSVVMSFKHCLDNYQGSHTLGIATTSDNGATWNVGWSQTYSSDGQWSINQEITTADMGQANVRFCIYYTGNSYNIDNWYFDDIEIFTQENLDIQLASIDVNSVLGAGNAPIACTVLNKGIETVNEIKLSYQVNDEPAVEETFNVNLATFASTQLTFAESVAFIPGSYTLTVNVETVNGGEDDVTTNNTLETNIGVALGSTQRIPMIEHFSSSTCGPCVSVNTQMLNLTNNNPGKFTYTKYQMNWPGNGDPYYTNEGGTRRTYYGVSAVPQCFLDGEDQGYAAVTQTTLDNHYNNPAFADVRGSFNVSGGVITVKVDFMSYYDLSTAKAFVSVNEKETHNNVGTNGETSFHHVFMKFLTSASGDAVNIEAGNYQHFEYSYDMSSTHVEEMSDLEVSAWLQELGTKEMLNSHFLYEYTNIHPYPVRDLAVALNEGMLTATWTAPEGFNAQAYNVYVNGVFAETVTGYEYSAPATADFNVVEVEAVYENDMTSVKMVKVASGDAPVACDPVTDLVAEYGEESGEHGAFVSWTAPAGAIEFMVYAGEYLYTTNGTSVFAGFDEEPAGTYTISVIAVYNECESDPVTVDFEWAGTTAVDETAVATNIYPNPTSGNFTIEGADMARVEVYNLVGQKVYEAQGKTVTVDASNWNKGIYMINILDQNGSSKTQKLMVK